MGIEEKKIVSLFAGGGGSSYGYKAGGGRVVLAVEMDKTAANNYRHNHLGTDVWEKSVTDVQGAEILNKYGNIDILDGSPPCQGFSQLNIKKGGSVAKNSLCFEMLRIADELKTTVFVMENVPEFAKAPEFKETVKEAKAKGYIVSAAIVDASRYGALTARKRVFIVGSRKGKFVFPKGDENKLNAADEIAKLKEPMRHGTLSERRGRMLGKIPPNATSSEIQKIMKGIDKISDYSNHRRIPLKGLALTQVKNGCLIHPIENRVLTIEEMALIQGFPITFWAKNHRDAMERIGNSVCPAVTKTIYEALIFQGLV